MNPDFKKYLLRHTQATDCKETEVIQSLWSGYGKISRFQMGGTPYNTLVVKHIDLSKTGHHPRGWDTDISHSRKVKSYEVETHWYKHWSQQTNDKCRIPKFVGSYTEKNEQWIVLEDLDENFPLRKQELDLDEVKSCLIWLANFHGTFIGQKPNGLWEVGTYWHLATRPDELEKVEHQELKEKAQVIDNVLSSCSYQTIVHGDAKLANFCFAKDGKSLPADRRVAAVDFQYVGGGCGMKDVAYFLSSCMSAEECELYESELLDVYFSELKQKVDTTVDAKSLEAEWRQMYPFAVADFMRFLLGWMPTHQKINAYSIGLMEEVLAGL